MTVFEFLASQKELYQRRMAPVSRRYSLTSMELAILLFLANNPSYDTAKEIVEKRYLTKSHVSVSVRSLEERGFLRKEYRNNDHRTEHLVLLPASQEAVREGQKVQTEFLEILTEGFSGTEKENLQNYLCRIYDNIITGLTER